MKEKIYTIPLNEAFEKKCECPFCELEKKLEKEYVEYCVGASMMEPDSRIISNEKGFCRRHFEMLSKEQKALSLALVLDTHIDEIEKIFSKNIKHKTLNSSSKKSSLSGSLDKINKSCVICDKLSYTLGKFARVFWYLYKNEPEFKEKVMSSSGFCLPHFALLLENATLELGKKAGGALALELTEFELSTLNTLSDDVNWFTKMFDYKNKDADWKNSKDAIKRAINKLSKFSD